MEVRPEILLIVLGCGAVTLLPRVLPLVLLRRLEFPGWFREWLSFIPVTVMTALVAQALIPQDGGSWEDAAPRLLAAAVCLACAVATRSLFATVLAGMLAILVVG